MPADDRSISEFPIALQLLNTALVLVSNEDGQGGYDSYKATLTELGRVVLETQYTQDLGNVDVFDAIKNCRVLSGTTTPTSQEGTDGQLYVKYTTSGNDTSVTGLYVKLSGSWCEISTGSGGDVGIECTQAQYDAWEQAGTLLQDTNYYITDGQSGGGVTIDDTSASLTTVYSSDKVEDLLDDKADTASLATVATSGSYNDLSNKPLTATGYRAWGTSLTVDNLRAMAFVGVWEAFYIVLLTGTNDIRVRNVNTNTGANGTGTCTLDGITFTRNNSSLTISQSSNTTMSVIGI